MNKRLLRNICSTIACQYLKVGDQVELVNGNPQDLGGNSFHLEGKVGTKFEISQIKKSFKSCDDYIVVSGLAGLGYWANCFRKISK